MVIPVEILKSKQKKHSFYSKNNVLFVTGPNDVSTYNEKEGLYGKKEHLLLFLITLFSEKVYILLYNFGMCKQK